MHYLDAKREALGKLIQICRAGRAGRNLDLVPAFAELEAELVAKRDRIPAAPEAAAAGTQQPEHAHAA